MKSSAPATTTRIRPSENATPPRRRTTPNGTSALPAVTVVAKIAPSAMKAPARTDRANVLAVDMPHLTTPTCSAFRAISTGGSASSPVGVKTRSTTWAIRTWVAGRDGLSAMPAAPARVVAVGEAIRAAEGLEDTAAKAAVSDVPIAATTASAADTRARLVGGQFRERDRASAVREEPLRSAAARADR